VWHDLLRPFFYHDEEPTMGMKLKLVGCERYNFRGELYERGKVYLVGDQKAELMLRSVDEFDRPYFAEYRKPLKSEAQRKAEEAAAAALAAAQAEEAEELVERPDDSGDAAPEVEVSESEEIDMDDDPDLDADDEENPEAVEEEDRDDGTAVEV
jgi:hypothetical protein